MNQDYLPLVIEEAAEVIQAAAKVQRFGPDRKYPKGSHANETNTEALALEVGDLLEVIEMLSLPIEIIDQGRAKKKEQLKKWGPERTGEQLDVALDSFQMTMPTIEDAQVAYQELACVSAQPHRGPEKERTQIIWELLKQAYHLGQSSGSGK